MIPEQFLRNFRNPNPIQNQLDLVARGLPIEKPESDIPEVAVDVGKIEAYKALALALKLLFPESDISINGEWVSV